MSDAALNESSHSVVVRDVSLNFGSVEVLRSLNLTIAPGEFLVHGLTREGALGCVDSEMDRRVTAGEGRG